MLGRCRRLARRILKSPLFRQFGGLTGARAGAAGISFLWLVVAARHLPLTDFADLALLLSVGAVASVLGDFGLALVLNEALAADPARGRSSLVMVIMRRMVLAASAVLLMGLLYRLAANNSSPAIPAVFALSIIASAWYTSCAAALRGAGSVVPEGMNEVLSRVFVLVVGATLVINGAGLLGAVAAYAAADLLSAVALTVVSWRRLSAEKMPDRTRFGIRRIMPLGLASITAIVYYRIDVWLLALLSEAVQVARYSVCYRILDVLILPAGALTAVAIGSTARLTDRAAIRQTDRMVGLLCLGVAPAVLLFEVFPQPLLRLAFGTEYAPGAPVLQILAFAVIPSVAALLWAPLVALRARGVLAISVGCLVANLTLNIAFIPTFGAEGAAGATVLCQVCFAALLRLRLRRLLGDAFPGAGAAPRLPNEMSSDKV